MIRLFNKKSVNRRPVWMPPQAIGKKPRLYNHPGGIITDPMIKDIIEGCHTLIGGTTGSGKSVLLDNIIYNILTCCDINNKLVLIDPKRVSLYKYSCLPQCLKYVEDPQDVLSVLDFVIENIDYRYKVMRAQGLEKYNGSRIFIIIDELADLMISPQSKAIKTKLQKILQIARASNVVVIGCTQSPSRKILDSSLVLNFTNRVALRCLSSIESRQIINEKGAENLPQYGSCLYMSPSIKLKKMDIQQIPQEYIRNAIDNWLYSLEVI